jgi:hypothetical protein
LKKLAPKKSAVWIEPVLMSIEDVSARVNTAVEPNWPPNRPLSPAAP